MEPTQTSASIESTECCPQLPPAAQQQHPKMEKLISQQPNNKFLKECKLCVKLCCLIFPPLKRIEFKHLLVLSHTRPGGRSNAKRSLRECKIAPSWRKTMALRPTSVSCLAWIFVQSWTCSSMKLTGWCVSCYCVSWDQWIRSMVGWFWWGSVGFILQNRVVFQNQPKLENLRAENVPWNFEATS